MTLDLQVNGYLNVDFSSENMTEEDLCYIIRKYLENGADSFLPTMITSPKEIYKKKLLKSTAFLILYCLAFRHP